MKKKIFAFVCAAIMIAVMLTMVGCDASEIFIETNTGDSNEAEAPKVQTKWDMENIEDGWFFTIYREPVTDVMYIMYNGSSEVGLTYMPDPETGGPLTYARWLELREAE